MQFDGTDVADPSVQHIFILQLCFWNCSAHAQLPINMDLEMTFPVTDGAQSYKPNFAVVTDDDNAQGPAAMQVSPGGHSRSSISLLNDIGPLLVCAYKHTCQI